MALFFACFLRKADRDEEAAEYLDEDVNVGADEEYLHSIKASHPSPFSYRHQTRVHRLHQEELAFLRDQRLKELKMWSIIREMLTYFCFLSLRCR